MPIASLSRFSVPLATDQSASNQGLLMPKLPYRFRVTLVDFGVGGAPATELTKQVVTVDRPKPSFEQIDLHVYNSIVKLAGKPKWEDIKLKLRDDMTNLVTNKVGEQMQKQFDFFEQSSAASGLDYKFTTYIELLDGGNGGYAPVPLETFELQGCWIKSVSYDGGDYGKSNEAMNIELTICYDNALQTVGINGGLIGIGSPTGRTVGTSAIGS
jgi:hypothetical protein